MVSGLLFRIPVHFCSHQLNYMLTIYLFIQLHLLLLSCYLLSNMYNDAIYLEKESFLSRKSKLDALERNDKINELPKTC